MELRTLKKAQTDLQVQCQEQKATIAYLQTEKDTFRDETKELNAIKNELQRETINTKMAARIKFLQLEEKVKRLNDDFARCAESLDKKSKMVQ